MYAGFTKSNLATSSGCLSALKLMPIPTLFTISIYSLSNRTSDQSLSPSEGGRGDDKFNLTAFPKESCQPRVVTSLSDAVWAFTACLPSETLCMRVQKMSAPLQALTGLLLSIKYIRLTAASGLTEFEFQQQVSINSSESSVSKLFSSLTPSAFRQ